MSSIAALRGMFVAFVFAGLSVVFDSGEAAVWEGPDAGTSRSEVKPVFHSNPAAATNLLANSGFEEGDTGVADWAPWPVAPGVGYRWESTAASGRRSVCVTSETSTAFGMWRQVVPIAPGVVYSLSGFVKTQDVIPAGRCGLQVVFRDAANDVVKMVDLPSHIGTRSFACDFPRTLMVRAPKGATAAEVNLLLFGKGSAWFDDIFFGPSPTGSISGSVTGENGPLAGARVMIWNRPWGAPVEAITDKTGRYVIDDVPVASPRYLLLASKTGFKTQPIGGIDVRDGRVTKINFKLRRGSDPVDDLRVKFASMVRVRPIPSPDIPADAMIPLDATGYPESVRPFLMPDRFIESNHPSIASLAKEILSIVPVQERSRTRSVAWAVYSWIVHNIEHDGVYQGGTAPGRVITVEEDFKDVTSGIWQTVTNEGWCWGRSFYDWAYRPSETLEERGVICAEHAWLAAALLRHLGIPARAAVGYNQLWVQVTPERGYWAYFSTTEGRGAYRREGILGAGFGTPASPAFYSVLSRPLLHEDWNWRRPGMWREIHPFSEDYEDTPEGLARAVSDLAKFSTTGEAPRGDPPDQPRPSFLMLHYADVTLNLLNVGDQRSLDVRFPFVSESASHSLLDDHAFWTNHPECVRRTWIEVVQNQPVEGVERWFHIELDITSLVD
ncbi:MAG: carboxypeptidase regulatory-like domain-containing protein [Acidobacteriota bacterium]